MSETSIAAPVLSTVLELCEQLAERIARSSEPRARAMWAVAAVAAVARKAGVTPDELAELVGLGRRSVMQARAAECARLAELELSAINFVEPLRRTGEHIGTARGLLVAARQALT